MYHTLCCPTGSLYPQLGSHWFKSHSTGSRKQCLIIHYELTKLKQCFGTLQFHKKFGEHVVKLLAYAINYSCINSTKQINMHIKQKFNLLRNELKLHCIFI